MSKRDQIRKALEDPRVRAALDMIAASELGEEDAARGGYDAVFGSGRFSDFSKHPGIRNSFRKADGTMSSSDDAGRYQFHGTTVSDLQKRYGFTDFTPQTQDEMAVALMMDVGALDDILKGDIQAALPKLARRWMSLPTSELGQALNGRTQSMEFALKAYNNALSKHSGGKYTPPETPKTTVPAMPGPATPLPQFRRPEDVTLDSVPQLTVRENVRNRLRQRYAQAPRLFVSTNQLTPETVNALGKAVSGEQVPVIANLSKAGPEVAEVNPQSDRLNLDERMRQFLNDQRVSVVNVEDIQEPVIEPAADYIQRELMKNEQVSDDPLSISALNMPYRDELLALIDRTAVKSFG